MAKLPVFTPTMKRIRGFVSLLLIAPLWGIAEAGAAEEAIFNTVRVGGRDYVNVADLARFYGLNRNGGQNNLEVALESRFKKFRFKINSRECSVNGVSIWLNDAPLESNSSILISEVDVQKTLDPILRPWGVPKRRVKTIMLDPGHGGEDKGTQGARGSVEKRLTLDLALRVEKNLRQNGFQTLMTRRTDTYVSLEDRADLANSSDADLFVSIHFNSAKPNPQPHGIETYCLTPAGLSSTGSLRQRLGLAAFGEEAGNEFDRQNMLLAYLVQQRLLSCGLKVQDRGVKRARFFVIKSTERPSILIENGFLSHPFEEKRIRDPVFRDKLAAAIGDGIKKYAALMVSAEGR